jgi:hypothetical protein
LNYEISSQPVIIRFQIEIMPNIFFNQETCQGKGLGEYGANQWNILKLTTACSP